MQNKAFQSHGSFSLDGSSVYVQDKGYFMVLTAFHFIS